MSKFLPAETQPPEPVGKREFWTATGIWNRYDGVEKVWRVEAQTVTALSRHELDTVTRNLIELRGGLDGFELMQQHHPIGRPAYRITDAIPTNPDHVPSLLAEARAALKRGAA
jgi:hypothetical protein